MIIALDLRDCGSGDVRENPQVGDSLSEDSHHHKSEHRH